MKTVATLFCGGALSTARTSDTERCVRLTSQCLARLQSFPDTYKLPDKPSLAATVIGNAVPPLLMQRIVESAGIV